MWSGSGRIGPCRHRRRGCNQPVLVRFRNKDGVIVAGEVVSSFERTPDKGEKATYLTIKDKNGYHVYAESYVKERKC